MSDETETPDLDAVKSELDTAAYNSIARILNHLADHYAPHFEDDFDLNEQFIRVLSTMLGDMLGHFPEERAEGLYDTSLKFVRYVMDMSAVDKSALSEDGPTMSAEEWLEKVKGGAVASEDDPYGLAGMKPQGRC